MQRYRLLVDTLVIAHSVTGWLGYLFNIWPFITLKIYPTVSQNFHFFKFAKVLKEKWNRSGSVRCCFSEVVPIYLVDFCQAATSFSVRNHLCIKHFLVVVQLWYVATNYLKKGLKYAHIDSWILQMEMYRRDLWRWVKRSILGRVGYILWPSSRLMFADNRIRRVNLFAYHSVWNKGPWKVFHWHATCMLKCPAVVVAQLGKMSAVRVLSSNFNLPTYCRLYWKTNLKKKEAGKGLKQGLKDTESNQSNRMER